MAKKSKTSTANPIQYIVPLMIVAIVGALAVSLSSMVQQKPQNPTPSQAATTGKLLFTRYTNTNIPLGANYDIFIMNSDGSGQTNLTNNPSQDQTASFSRNNSKIVFSSTRDDLNPSDGDQTFEIYTMNADGTGQTRMTYTNTTTKAVRNLRPSFSPDGVYIVYQSTFRTLPNGVNTTDIHRIRADGTSTRLVSGKKVTTPVVLNSQSLTQESPSYSPSSIGKIVYTNEGQTIGNSGYKIFTMSPTGANKIRLGNSTKQDRFPSYSPNGSRIVFQQTDYPGATNANIYTMKASDGTDRKLLTTNTGEDVHPDYSPDNTQVVYAAKLPGIKYDIYIINVDPSGGPIGSPVRLTTDPQDEFEPSFSNP